MSVIHRKAAIVFRIVHLRNMCSREGPSLRPWKSLMWSGSTRSTRASTLAIGRAHVHPKDDRAAQKVLCGGQHELETRIQTIATPRRRVRSI